jgi:hypothetical protein
MVCPQRWSLLLGVNLTLRCELCPLKECWPLRSPLGWTLSSANFTPPGDNFTPRGQKSPLGDNFAPWGQSLPLGAKLRLCLRLVDYNQYLLIDILPPKGCIQVEINNYWVRCFYYSWPAPILVDCVTLQNGMFRFVRQSLFPEKMNI